MITIRHVQFDFQMENQSFAQTLYGRWDDFCRASFEKVLDDVLSRYDQDETCIRLETLDLDLGTLSEEDFYDQFPRRLARRLDEIFSAYLADKEAHPAGIQVFPIKKTYLERFSFYLLHGYLSWEEERPEGTLTDFLNRIIEEEPRQLLDFLYREGSKLAVRTRLVLQFSDPQLDSLVALTVPSDSRFVQKFVRFLIESHKRMERPDIRANDYRQVVWGVVWAYLLAESKGYYSRKQFVQHTLWQLAARYNLTYLQLLDLLTSGLNEFISVRAVVPELVTLLADIRREEWLRFSEEKIQSERLALQQLIGLLSVPESCRRLLRNQPETVICGWVEKIVPQESSFIIGYARALDQEKERGLLEGKGADDFRFIKWEFIFQVFLVDMRDSFNRTAFVYSVLKQLAAHYNIRVGELLSFLYIGLVCGKAYVDPRLRELMTALFLEAADRGDTFSVRRFPSPLTQTLAHSDLCRRFLHPLSEEKIYKLVDQVIPAESAFIVNYARVLDKGKEQNALAGKAGGEFRIVKWEFIFLLLLRAPLSYFSRKQFVRSVLQQIAAHYNLRVAELIRFFSESLRASDSLFSSEVGGVWMRLFEEMEEESPESLLTLEARKEGQVACLDAFLTGSREVDPAVPLEEFVRDMAGREPSLLTEAICRLRRVSVSVFAASPSAHPASERIWAFLLQFVIRQFGLNFPRQYLLVKSLEAVEAGGLPGHAETLRWLLYFCINRQAEDFQRVLESWLETRVAPAALTAGEAGEKTGIGSRPAIPAKTPSNPNPNPNPEPEPPTGVNRKNRPGFFVPDVPDAPGPGKTEPQSGGRRLPENERGGQPAAQTATPPMPMETGTLPPAPVSSPLASDSFPPLSYRWLQQHAPAVSRTVIEELLLLGKHAGVEIDASAWLSFLVSLTAKPYAYYSAQGLLETAWEKLHRIVSPEEMEKLLGMIGAHPERWPGLAGVLLASDREKASGRPDRPGRSEEAIPEHVYIRNAGLVLFAPYFPRLFSVLHLLDAAGQLTEAGNQVKAIFCMQYLATAEKEIPEYELFLNKLLSGYPADESFSPFFDFEESEKQILLSLLNSVKHNWNQMKNTSIEGFRNSFLLREGVLEEKEDRWVLTVESRAYDLLLDTLPWSYSPVKFSWMSKPVYVKWR